MFSKREKFVLKISNVARDRLWFREFFFHPLLVYISYYMQHDFFFCEKNIFQTCLLDGPRIRQSDFLFVRSSIICPQCVQFFQASDWSMLLNWFLVLEGNGIPPKNYYQPSSLPSRTTTKTLPFPSKTSTKLHRIPSRTTTKE